MTALNVFYMPASRGLWRDIATHLTEGGAEPAIWLGDWRHDDFAKKTYPNCEVLNFKTFQLQLSKRETKFVPPASYLRSKEFIQLKSQTLKLMDRQDESRAFGRLEREAYFYSMFNHLYSLIVERKIDAYVIGEAPHFTAQLIAYRICESLNIPTYHLVGNSFVPLVEVSRHIVGEPLQVVGKPDISNHIEEMTKALDAYRGGMPTPLYMQNQAKFDRDWKFSRYLLNYWKHLVGLKLKPLLGKTARPDNDTTFRSRFPFQKNQKHWLTPIRINALRLALEKEYAELSEFIDLTDKKLPKFVYFPMPYEPERTSNPDGGDFYDAMDALLALRAYLPADVEIFVKEHPSQFARKLAGHKGRSPWTYQVIKNLAGVRLVSLDVPSSKLIESAEFVACITGTAALEAALVGKKGVIFGTPWFYRLPGVELFDNLPAYNKFVARPAASVDEITKAALSAIGKYSIPGCISVSQDNYYRQKFGEKFAQLTDDTQMARMVADTILKDLKSVKR